MSTDEALAAIEAAVHRRGDTMAVVMACQAAGVDPGPHVSRSFNLLAYGRDIDHQLSMDEIKAIEADAAEHAIAAAIRDHGNRGTLTYWREYVWGTQHTGGVSVHDRDMPEVAARIILAGCCTEAGARDFAAHAWTKPEFPETNLSRDAWLAVFEATGFLTHDVEDDEDEAAPVRPTQTMRLYRGATEARRDGMAWTSRYETAVWFAERFNGALDAVGTVWAAEVEPDRVLARFDRRGEYEFVIDPDGLTITEAAL